jgi:hypothetical protein
MKDTIKSKLKLVQSIEDPIAKIASKIRDGSWPVVETVDISQFVVRPTPDTFNINTNKSLQVRTKTIDFKFVDRQVRKVKNTGDTSALQDPVLVYFPTEVGYEGLAFKSDTYALLDRNHGVLIKMFCGIEESNAFIVRFDTDLGSKLSNIKSLGNQLNVVWEERQPTSIDDVKSEYHELIDENIKAKLGSSLSAEQNATFLNRYPFLHANSLKNFASSHSEGGRARPAWIPSQIEQDDTLKKYEKIYPDYIISTPSTIAAWSGEAIGRATMRVLNNDNPERDDRKLVFLFYANTKTQNKESFQNKVSRRLKGEWKERFAFDDVVVIFMKANSNDVIV